MRALGLLRFISCLFFFFWRNSSIPEYGSVVLILHGAFRNIGIGFCFECSLLA